jgi:NTE family protein
VVLAARRAGGAVLRAALLARAPSRGLSLSDLHRRIAALDIRFDGRLRVVCVERSRGTRVVFGTPGAPQASIADAVTASCAIPWVFEPVQIGGRSYVDGGVWSLTNLDAAPIARGTRLLCLNPTASLPGRAPGPLAALRGVTRAAATLETQALRRRGAEVQMVIPDATAGALMGTNLMDPRPAAQVLAAGFEQGLALGSAAS